MMEEIYGLPQPLDGSELVTIHQLQNGQWAKCTMPLSTFQSFAFSSWVTSLPTAKPSSTGIAWNDSGSISIS